MKWLLTYARSISPIWSNKCGNTPSNLSSRKPRKCAIRSRQFDPGAYMTKARSVALVCAGQVSRSGLVRLPALAEQLALVKSTHLRQASRAANALRAGTAVSTYEQLAKAKTFLI